MKQHDVADLIAVFNGFAQSKYRTILVKGDDEPIYLPADAEHPWHRIVFAHGFFASALHEVAHWCIAGSARRELIDYGYWYIEDGRNAAQQAAFEAVEVKPQALEYLFAEACGVSFQVSCDNLMGVDVDRHAFTQKVLEQVAHYRKVGLPPRAAEFVQVCEAFYQPHLDAKNNEDARVASCFR